MTRILIGADPEVFVRAKNYRPIIAAGLIPGTKQEPAPIPGLPGSSMQVDGLALEFNIPPCETAEEFTAAIDSALKALAQMLPPHLMLHIVAATHFSAKQMKLAPPESLVLGCEPDFSAYTGRANPRPNAPPTLRTAAGHIHIGWTSGKGVDREHAMMGGSVCRALDATLGMLMLALDKSPASAERRALYGAAGAFRPKSYGCEYRVLSNWWLTSPELRTMVFEVAQDVARQVVLGAQDLVPMQETVFRNAINRGGYGSHGRAWARRALDTVLGGKYTHLVRP